MLKYSKSALGLLNNQYRSVLKKCLLLNFGLMALALPAKANITEITADNLNDLTATKISWSGPETSVPATGQYISVDDEEYYVYSYSNADNYTENNTGVSNPTAASEVTDILFSGYIADEATKFGAVYNENNNSSMNIVADFVDNSGSDVSSTGYEAHGAGIYNEGSFGTVSGAFAHNTIELTTDTRVAGGAAMQNYGTIGNIDGNFVGNIVSAEQGLAMGGAILNLTSGIDIVSSVTPVSVANDIALGNITANFIGNAAEMSPSVFGGAIANVVASSDSSATIGNISGDFIANYIDGDDAAFGGAIANMIYDTYTNATASIGNIVGNFLENDVYADTEDALGGAIYNSTNADNDAEAASIVSISGEFIGNNVESTDGNAFGGAIYNNGLIGVVDADEGETVGIVNSSFTDNTAFSENGTALGGAIATTQDLNFTAQDAYESIFTDNAVMDDNGLRDEAIAAIKLSDADEAPILTFSAITDGSFTFDDQISGVDGYKVVLNGDETGVINLNNKIVADYALNSGKIEYTGNQTGVDVSVENVTLNLGDMTALSADRLSLNSATLDVANGELDNVEVGSIVTTDGANGAGSANLAIDIDLASNVADTFTVTDTAGGIYNFKDMNVLNLPTTEGSYEVEIFKAPTTAAMSDLVMNTYDSIYSDMNQISLSQGEGDKIGFLQYEYTEGNFSLNDAVAFEEGNRQFNMTQDSDIDADLGQMGGVDSTLDIVGNGYAINGNGFEGITVDEGQTLNIADVQSMNGFEPAAVSVNEGGVANISNTTFSDNGTDVINNGLLALNGDNTFDGTITGTGTLHILSGYNVFNDDVTQDAIAFESSAARTDDPIMNIGTNQVTTDEITFTDNSTLALNIDSASEYGSIIADTINVENGAVLQATLAQGIVQTQPVTLQLLSAQNQDFNNFTDQFDNQMYKFEKSGLNGAYTISLAKTAAQVSAENGGTSNNQNTAAAWADGGLFTNENEQQLANKISATAQNTPNELNDGLTALAPNDAPVVQNTTIVLQNHLYDAVEKHLRSESLGRRKNYGRSSGDGMYDDMEIWVSGYMGHNKLQRQGMYYGFDSDTLGGIVGLEKKISEHGKIGMGYHYDHTKVDAFSRDTKVNTHSGFLYGEYKPSAMFVNLTASYGYSTYKDKKHAFGDTYHGKYHANVYGLQGLTGVEYIGQYIDVTPQIGLRYSYIDRESYSDSAGQNVGSKSMDILTGVAGLKLGKDLYYGKDCHVMRPEIYAGVTYDFISDRDNAVVSLGNGSTYVINGKRLDRMGYEMGAGITAELSDHWSGNISYIGDLRNHYQNHSGMIGLSYAF